MSDRNQHNEIANDDQNNGQTNDHQNELTNDQYADMEIYNDSLSNKQTSGQLHITDDSEKNKITQLCVKRYGKYSNGQV